MEVRTDSRFHRDLRRIRDNDLRDRIRDVIESIESASTIPEIPGIRKMTARGNFYRIRVRDYRLGLEIEGDVVTLVRFGHRREIYRRFP